jgi:hypothetical protein
MGFECIELLPRDQAIDLNLEKACMVQLADEFVFGGQSPAIHGRCSPQIENFNPQTPSLTTGNQ